MESAISEAWKILTVVKKAGDDTAVSLYTTVIQLAQRGEELSRNGDIKSSVIHLEKATKLLEGAAVPIGLSGSHSLLLGSILAKLANALNVDDRFFKAEEVSRRAISLLNGDRLPLSLVAAYVALGISHYNHGEKLTGRDSFNHARNILRTHEREPEAKITLRYINATQPSLEKLSPRPLDEETPRESREKRRWWPFG